MVTKGIVQGGVIVVEGLELPEGTEVTVHSSESTAGASTLFDRFRDVIGAAKGLPEDLAENHDHYLHGLPKR